MAIKTKKDARREFGVPYGTIADECGIARSTLAEWKDPLTKAQINMLEGALLSRKRRMRLALLTDNDLLDDD